MISSMSLMIQKTAVVTALDRFVSTPVISRDICVKGLAEARPVLSLFPRCWVLLRAIEKGHGDWNLAAGDLRQEVQDAVLPRIDAILGTPSVDPLSLAKAGVSENLSLGSPLRELVVLAGEYLDHRDFPSAFGGIFLMSDGNRGLVPFDARFSIHSKITSHFRPHI